MAHVEFTRNRLFHRLPEALTRQLFDAGEVLQVPSDTVIVNEGEDLDRLFVVLSGRVSVYLPANESRFSLVKLTMMGPGDCFGEYAFIDRGPASASISAASHAEVYAIHFDTLQKFLDEHHIVASIIYRNLLNILVKRLRDSNAELDLFGFSG